MIKRIVLPNSDNELSNPSIASESDDEKDEYIEKLRKNFKSNEKRDIKADDFVRNFMFCRGMLKALAAFQVRLELSKLILGKVS